VFPGFARIFPYIKYLPYFSNLGVLPPWVLCPLCDGSVVMDITGTIEDRTLHTVTKCEVVLMIAIATSK
jgi:hypothetical protein